MTDDIFRQTKKKINPQDLSNPLEQIEKIQEAVSKELGTESKSFDKSPFQIAGNIPPEFKAAMAKRKEMKKPDTEDGFEPFEAPPELPRPKSETKMRIQGSDALEGLLQQLISRHKWEPFEFPSKGRFYSNIPSTIHVRAMSGEEEQILATPRLVKKGMAIDMIFERCIQEKITTQDLLSVDRNHLLIYLRGISYTPEYDVEIKCPNCGVKFAHVIDLNDIDVNMCPDNFGPENLEGTLPSSGFGYRYRLSTGSDEQEISRYRDQRIQQWGDQGNDDTLLYRTALLLEEIEGVTMKKELGLLLKKLPIQDVSFLRNEISEPPFGANTKISILCPSCTDEFTIDLPLEVNFFFPRKKREEIQV